MDKITKLEGLSFFRGKRVFITGHTGFKGSWLSFLLASIGADVMGYALAPNTEPNHFDMLGLSRDISHVIGDIRDAKFMQSQIKAFKPEIVFHLAAQALVKNSYIDPVLTFDTNIMGSLNLLEAVRHSDSVKSLVYITSDKCYENLEWVWGYRENDRLGGRDPYSASKAAAEIVFDAYTRSYFSAVDGFGAASARAGNVIGGGDWAADRIVPDCIRAITTGNAIKLRNPFSTRPWQHVLEPLSGYLALAKSLYESPKKFQGPWNFGPNSSEVRTVEDVAKSIIRTFGKGEIELLSPGAMHHEANLLQLNCDKANAILGWRPTWGVEKTFQITGEWYRWVANGNNAREITQAQVKEFFEGVTL